MRAALALALLWPALASAWPADPDLWQPLTLGGGTTSDPAGDHDSSFDGMDLLGLPAAPGALWAADAGHLYLRLRVAGDPAPSGVIPLAASWSFLLDLDYDPAATTDADWEYEVVVAGTAGTVSVWHNASQASGTDALGDNVSGSWGDLASGAVRTVDQPTTTSWFVDLALDRDDLAELQIHDATALRVAVVTGEVVLSDARVDTLGCEDDVAADCTLLTPILSDPIAVDADLDGLTGPAEILLGTDSADADTDDDGLLDGEEAATTEGGIVPALSCDSDGDGLSDGVEAGVAAAHDDTDPAAGCFVADADPGTTTDGLALDTDGGGLPDGVEDHDHDGLYDPTCWETDPEDPGDDGDSDQDGIADVLEYRAPDSDLNDVDSDGDGLSDVVEGLADPDGDCLPAFVDLDSDDDGIPDADEGGGDTDGDGAPDSVDDDADGDGVPDDVEGTADSDCDGVADWQDANDYDHSCDEPPAEVPDDAPAWTDGYFSGGACSTLPAGALGWPAWLAAGLLLLRRRRWGVLALLAPSAALAQEVNAQHFAPAVDGDRFLELHDGAGPDAPWGVGFLANYADDPLVFRTPGGAQEEIAVLGAVLTGDVLGFWRLGPVQVGFDLPVHLYTSGYDIAAPTHLGDVRLSGKVDLGAPLGTRLAAWSDLGLPTGSQRAYVGDARAELGVGLAAARDLGSLVAALDVGFRTGHGTQVGEVAVAPALVARAGLAYGITDGVWAALELDGEQWLRNGGQRGGAPVEWIASGRFRTGPALVSTIGFGSGLTQGLGAPDFRLVGGVSWSPVARPVAAVAEEPEAPALGQLVVRAMGPSGRPVAGAEVRIVGTLGIPMKTGTDGLLEAGLRPGKWEVTVAAPGWRAESRTAKVVSAERADLVVVLHPEEVVIDTEARQIYLHRKVFFELDRADLRVESLRVLDDLVVSLKEHPEVARLRIEGHTDTQGADPYNLDLSARRAEAVRDYLVTSGVAPERLVAEGFGERRPLQEGETEEVHATNRRVEFHILE